VIEVDASAIEAADAGTLEALARAQLAAHRRGMTLRLRNPRRELVDLLTLAGLAALLGVEPEGHVEQREVLRVDEEVDPGDPVA